mmetsp:Transcript_13347/g.28874  ORF Transcript_13347/g.28874 Transcript_13347/m.28874 type:complete len:226 (+) Transcript_13347:1260-1937(+)
MSPTTHDVSRRRLILQSPIASPIRVFLVGCRIKVAWRPGPDLHPLILRVHNRRPALPVLVHDPGQQCLLIGTIYFIWARNISPMGIAPRHSLGVSLARPPCGAIVPHGSVRGGHHLEQIVLVLYCTRCGAAHFRFAIFSRMVLLPLYLLLLPPALLCLPVRKRGRILLLPLLKQRRGIYLSYPLKAVGHSRQQGDDDEKSQNEHSPIHHGTSELLRPEDGVPVPS